MDRMLLRRGGVAVLVVATIGLLAGCSSTQDEGLVTQTGGSEGQPVQAPDPEHPTDPDAVWSIPFPGQVDYFTEWESLDQLRDWTDTVIVGHVVGVEPTQRPVLSAGVVLPGTVRYLVTLDEVIGGRFAPTASSASRGTVAIDVPVLVEPSEFDLIVERIQAAPRDGRYLLFLNHILKTQPELRRLPVYEIAYPPLGVMVEDRDGRARPLWLQSGGTDATAHRGFDEQVPGRTGTEEADSFDDVVASLRSDVGRVSTPPPSMVFPEEAYVEPPPPDPAWPVATVGD